MVLNTTLTDNDFLNEIVNCTLSPELFTHEAQLRLSWILINKYGLEVATLKNCKIKERYFIKALNNNKFNLPLTKAYTEILHFFMESSQSKDFEKLLREFPRLKFHFKNLVKTHYGYNILKEHRTKELDSLNPTLYSF